MNLNENNIQAPFQYKISENTFELKTVSGGFYLDTDNVQVKVFSGQRLFCADIGYAVDGAVEEMEFLIDDIKVYPQVLESLEDLQTVEVKDNEVYLIRNELDFKSIVFFPPSDLNKKFDFTITSYSSTFSSFMFDEIAKKLNSLDINYPIKNYYENADYKINDIIKYNGYLYRVFKDFTGDSTDYYIKTDCSLITPFKKLELDNSYKVNELIEYNNNFFIVQKDFLYQKPLGVLTNLNGLLKPLQDIIIWFDGITKIYKNQIVIKDNFSYIVLEDIENPVWGNIQSKLDYLNKASNTFYDDSNSSFGNNTNTVQKAIEKLKSNKQDSLIAGNNINLNGNAISVDGGTSKEYIIDNSYFINDLIIKDDKIYRVNEDFISSDFNTDRVKLTLISSGGGGASAAIDVSFDNSNSNLEYFSGYDFPKFKTHIADTNTINISYDRTNITTTFNKVDENYVWQGDFENVVFTNRKASITIDNINTTITGINIVDFLLQFFNFNSIANNNNNQFINLDENEIILEKGGVQTTSCKILLKTNSPSVDSFSIIIEPQGSEGDIDGSMLVHFNIKNKILRLEETNLVYYNTELEISNLNITQNNSSVLVQGNFTSNITYNYTYFIIISSLVEDYFNITVTNGADPVSQLVNTTFITSSSGKAVKFGLYKLYDNQYFLFLAYQDGSQVQQGDVFTFNLTPDKNSALDPVYMGVNNIQDAIETIVKRLVLLESANKNIEGV
ncbi:phage tail protein [Brachyspira murdochii]|uniref:phage tail protein n=1 Tax=Brachyspira murdochii TaxID=84378 RepID=UPI0012F4C07B|nr:phage tail protein [Brachyspira murdochii]